MKKIITIIITIISLSANAQIVVNSLAGSITSGFADGTGAAASFSSPSGVAFDGSANLYIADKGNNTIRQVITSTSAVTTLAGSITSGFVDGTGAAASFSSPSGVAFDGNANLYIADQGNNAIRQIVIATGAVTTLAGSTTSGYADGTGVAARFNNPVGVVCDGSGNLYVTDYGNNMIRQIVIATGVVTTLAGSTTSGYANGTGAVVRFNNPAGVVYDGNGNLYVTDYGNNAIRKIVIATGAVTTLAGSTTVGFADNTGVAARFNSPSGVAYDGNANLYIADKGNNAIRKIVIATGAVTTLAGSSTSGYADGTGAAARFNSPDGLACDASGNVYVADNGNNEIREIGSAGTALNFNGSNNYCGSAIFSNITNNLTLEARVNWAGPPVVASANGLQMIITNGTTSANGYALFVNCADSVVSVLLGGIAFMSSNAKLTIGNWQTVSVVCDQTTWTFYLDGTAYPLTNNTSTPNSIAGGFAIGSDEAGSENFNGTIDEVRFWNRALCQQEITSRLNCSLIGNTSDLIALYNFNQGLATLNNSTVTSLADSSGNAHNLTLYSFALNGVTSNWIAPTGTHNNSCSSFQLLTITGSPNICIGDSVLLTAAQGSSYLWSNGSITQSITAKTAGKDSVTITNLLGCIGTVTSPSANITVHALPTITANSNTANLCVGNTAMLTANGNATSYLWNTGDTTSSITVSPIINTPYTVTGKSSMGCYNKALVTQSVSACATSIEQYNGTSNDVTVYPNPNNGSFVVTTTANPKTTILVTNVLGNELLSINPTNTTTNINLSAQPSGMYFIKVIIDGGAQTIKHIIINNN